MRALLAAQREFSFSGSSAGASLANRALSRPMLSMYKAFTLRTTAFFNPAFIDWAVLAQEVGLASRDTV